MRVLNNGRTLCASIALACVFLSLVTAVPTTTSNDQSLRLVVRIDSEVPAGVLNCETERSDDYYGLGVRLGIYFAWLQAWIANVCVPDEIGTALDTNTIFFAAVLLAMVRCTISGLLHQMDGLILMHMAGGFLFSVSSLWGYRTCVYDVYGPTGGIRRFGGYGTHFRLLISLAVSVYGLYYWAWGLTGNLAPTTSPAGCDVVYTFMFAKVRADGGIRIFYIFICIACMLYFGSLSLVAFVALPDRVRRLIQTRREGWDESTLTRNKFMTGLNQKQLRYIFYFCRIGNLLFILYSMLLIEFSLNYNNIVGVTGSHGHIGFPSQLVPTIIGAFGFVRVVLIRYNQWRSEPITDHQSSKSNQMPKPQRDIMHPVSSELWKIYTPKSSSSMRNATSDEHMDSRMDGKSIWLRLLVTWAPWLGVLYKSRTKRTHTKKHSIGSESEHQMISYAETPNLNGGWSSETTPRGGSFDHRTTWESDETITSYRGQLPELPRNISHFGTL